MIRYKGAYENELGSAFCSACGNKAENWEKISASLRDRNLVYTFICKKCKKRITMEISKE